MSPRLSSSLRRDRGVALVLVLCFVVLITGLVVAYFSRTLTTRQLANASTSSTMADLLANSAADVVLGDLRTEIVNGSSAPPGSLPAGVTIYVPTTAADSVPQRNVAPTPAPGTGPAISPVPNLVRRSLRTDSTAGNANNVPFPGVTSHASAANSATASANGRIVSTARWNRHYLIPTTAHPSSSSLTASTPVADFTAPDWVFVTAEKGPEVLTSPFKDASGNTVTPTGRYAYAIYDEGGLLDINHSGYPSASSPGHIGGKRTPGYADLTQLPSPTPSSNLSLLTTAAVDSLVAWRNYATLQPSGMFPTLQPSPSPNSSADLAYYNLSTQSVTSPLQVPLTVYNSKTDQMFLSRQQLIGYFAAAGLDPRYLQYLGTFSRSLNQPSYAPEPSRPQVLPITSGGNDSYGNTGITPNFLTARVVNAFTRYDGTQAVPGEPLMKKRFSLNRLAWLTYQGPSARRSINDPDMVALIAEGITPAFLQQGTPENILTYFGLRWDASSDAPKWSYVHGTNGANGAILNVSNSAKLVDVSRLVPGREPDFFELLKASINPGSLAKSSLGASILNDDSSYARQARSQYYSDPSLDTAIMQIGANIIDQFDTDSFPTQINFDLAGSGTSSGVVYGIENLPYISQVRCGLIRLVEANPPEAPTDGNPSVAAIINTGVAAQMNFPEIWNPHGWSSSNLTQSMGAIGPAKFKIYAQTSSISQQAFATTVWDRYNNYSCDADWNSTPSKSPGFNSVYGFQFGTPGSNRGGENRSLSELNTEMTFSIDRTTGGALFREPTILFRPNIPAGSQLASSALLHTANDTYNLGALNANPSFFASGGGLLSIVNASTSNKSGYPRASSSSTQYPYIGFYLGAHPLRWWGKNLTPPQGCIAGQTQFGYFNDVQYILACEDGMGGTIFYDTKSLTTSGSPNANLYTGTDTGFGLNGTIGSGSQTMDSGVRYYETVDPRSSRWGMLDPWVQSNANSIPPRNGAGFLISGQGTLRTTREGPNSGGAFYFGSLNGTFFPYNAGGEWFPASMGWYHDSNLTDNNSFRPGLLAQNNPAATPDGVISSTSPALPAGYNTSGTFPPFYYADADGVVRRASGGNVPGSTSNPATTTVGLATASASLTTTPTNGTTTSAAQIDSRPVILNRPFRSVAELGYVYSGTPWKNLDFFLPESGDVAMLDVFCVNDNSDANAMMAGQVNLNTQQAPVLQAILAQTTKDVWNDASANAGTSAATITGGNSAGAQALAIAQLLVARTSTATGPATGPNGGKGPQPLQNVSDLVGKWVSEKDLVAAPGSNANGAAGINGQLSYDGFTADLANYLDTISADSVMHNIQRFGESAVRALANAGQTRVWNLMFDIVAQSGRYNTQATSLDQFNVEGEQHYWVHVAIDRYTGQILDKQVEVVKE